VEAAFEGETGIMVSMLARREADNMWLAMRPGGEWSKREHAVAV